MSNPENPFQAAEFLDKEGVPRLTKQESDIIDGLSESTRISFFKLFNTGAFKFPAAPFIQFPMPESQFTSLTAAEQAAMLKVLVRATEQRQTAVLALRAAAKKVEGIAPIGYAVLGLGAGYIINKAKPLIWLGLGAGAYYLAENNAEKKLQELQQAAKQQVAVLLAKTKGA